MTVSGWPIPVQAQNDYVPFLAWTHIHNIGDTLMPHIIEKVMHARPLAVAPQCPHVLGVGSIIFMADSNSHIWGSGVKTEQMHLPDIDTRKIAALRGNRTADYLVRNGYCVPDVPFGDPGVLVAEFYEPSKQRVPGFHKDIVLIPHHMELDYWTERYSGSAEVQILDPCTNDISFLDALYHAKVVISESLHGLIFASAFQKDVTWIAAPDADLFKYHDWFSMVENPEDRPRDRCADIDELVRAARPHLHKINLDELKDAFPKDVTIPLPEQGRVDYRISREQNPFCFYFSDHQQHIRKWQFPALHCFDTAMPVADSIFSCWDERPYAIAISQGHGVLPSRQQLDAIVWEMDHNPQHDFAVIALHEQVAAAGLAITPLQHGMGWALGSLQDVSTVVIRPTGRRDGEEHVIFCV